MICGIPRDEDAHVRGTRKPTTSVFNPAEPMYFAYTHLTRALIPNERILRHYTRADSEDGEARENHKLLRMMKGVEASLGKGSWRLGWSEQQISIKTRQ